MKSCIINGTKVSLVWQYIQCVWYMNIHFIPTFWDLNFNKFFRDYNCSVIYLHASWIWSFYLLILYHIFSDSCFLKKIHFSLWSLCSYLTMWKITIKSLHCPIKKKLCCLNSCFTNTIIALMIYCNSFNADLLRTTPCLYDRCCVLLISHKAR